MGEGLGKFSTKTGGILVVFSHFLTRNIKTTVEGVYFPLGVIGKLSSRGIYRRNFRSVSLMDFFSSFPQKEVKSDFLYTTHVVASL